MFGISTGEEGDDGGILGSIFGGRKAAGDYMRARPGGRLIQVAEGGYDEVVLTTDPRHRRRTKGLLGAFLERTGLLDGFDIGGWVSSMQSGFGLRIPSFAAGDWIPAGGVQLAGAGGAPTVNMGGVHLHGVKDYRSFQLNKAAMERDLSRAARRGVDHWRKG